MLSSHNLHKSPFRLWVQIFWGFEICGSRVSKIQIYSESKYVNLPLWNNSLKKLETNRINFLSKNAWSKFIFEFPNATAHSWSAKILWNQLHLFYTMSNNTVLELNIVQLRLFITGIKNIVWYFCVFVFLKQKILLFQNINVKMCPTSYKNYQLF